MQAIIGVTSLIGFLIVLGLGTFGLMLIDSACDKNREH